MKIENTIIKELQSNLETTINTVFILGSGWNEVVHDFKILKSWDFETLFGVDASVPGHEGKLILGEYEGKQALLQAGRFHTYEGFSSFEVTLPLRVYAALGIGHVVLTSAAGALNEKYQVGDIVILKDTLNLFLDSPIKGAEFVDLSRPFDEKMKQKAITLCQNEKYPYQEGVYAYVKGPHYESFADKKALKALGADVVGMSICPEVIMANYLKMHCLGLSCVTNLAFVKHSHSDVVNAALSVSARMASILEALL